MAAIDSLAVGRPGETGTPSPAVAKSGLAVETGKTMRAALGEGDPPSEPATVLTVPSARDGRMARRVRVTDRARIPCRVTGRGGTGPRGLMATRGAVDPVLTVLLGIELAPVVPVAIGLVLTVLLGIELVPVVPVGIELVPVVPVAIGLVLTVLLGIELALVVPVAIGLVLTVPVAAVPVGIELALAVPVAVVGRNAPMATGATAVVPPRRRLRFRTTSPRNSFLVTRARNCAGFPRISPRPSGGISSPPSSRRTRNWRTGMPRRHAGSPPGSASCVR
jgi:hypothetical protein